MGSFNRLAPEVEKHKLFGITEKIIFEALHLVSLSPIAYSQVDGCSIALFCSKFSALV